MILPFARPINTGSAPRPASSTPTITLLRMLCVMGFLLFTSQAVAQSCSGYYFMQADKTIETAVYNKKGDETARQIYRIKNVSDGGGTVTADVDTEMVDKKGKKITSSSSRIQCTGGMVMVDMKLAIPMQQGQTVQTDVKSDDIYLEYPASLNVGDKLKDASMHLETENQGGMKQTIDMEILDRQVLGQEKVTTTAGSWDCFRISQKIKMRVKTMGIGMPMNMDMIEWYAPGFGVVKTESKQGSTAIVSIK